MRLQGHIFFFRRVCFRVQFWEGVGDDTRGIGKFFYHVELSRVSVYSRYYNDIV